MFDFKENIVRRRTQSGYAITTIFLAVCLLTFLSNYSFAKPVEYVPIRIFTAAGLNNDGQGPASSLIQGMDGFLYGTTYSGGSAGRGNMYRVLVTGAISVLHSFGDGTVLNDGLNSYGGLVQASNGYLYGTTLLGGLAGKGAAYRTMPTGITEIIHHFGDGSVANDANSIYGNLIQANNGILYGTSYLGGTANKGTVFSMSTTGAVTILHSFGDGSVANDGMNPYAGLVQASDGNFYGTTYFGGATIGSGFGTIFRISSTGSYSVLHQFSDGSVQNDGTNPYGNLIQANDGNLYGTTYGGGGFGSGTCFRISASGVYSVHHSIGMGGTATEGARPICGLIQAKDNNLYGTCQSGGSADRGVLFRLSLTGSYSAVYSFQGGNSDGRSPVGGLVQGWDGFLYGTTQNGGPADNGTVFQFGNPITTNLLWRNTSGAASLWSLGSANAVSAIASFGPYSGWNPIDAGTFQDGSASLMWKNASNALSIWSLSSDLAVRNVINHGPYVGWVPKAVTPRDDGKEVLLWQRSDGACGVWLENPISGLEKSVQFGPYTNWTPQSIAFGGGVTALHWIRSDGATTIWELDANLVPTVKGNVYGPYSGYTALRLSLDSAGNSDLLWNRNDGAANQWDTERYTLNTISKISGPYSGWSAFSEANDVKGGRNLGWVSTNGTVSLWRTTGAIWSASPSIQNYGPYSGWTPIAISSAH